MDEEQVLGVLRAVVAAEIARFADGLVVDLEDDVAFRVRECAEDGSVGR